MSNCGPYSNRWVVIVGAVACSGHYRGDNASGDGGDATKGDATSGGTDANLADGLLDAVEASNDGPGDAEGSTCKQFGAGCTANECCPPLMCSAFCCKPYANSCSGDVECCPGLKCNMQMFSCQ